MTVLIYLDLADARPILDVKEAVMSTTSFLCCFGYSLAPNGSKQDEIDLLMCLRRSALF